MKMLHVFALLALAILTLQFPNKAEASCTAAVKTVNNSLGTVLYTGSCTTAAEVLITTDTLAPYRECSVMSSTGAVDIVVSIDGTTYSTTVMAVRDQTATTLTNVVVTAALKQYWFNVSFTSLKIRQNGATAAAAQLFCRS